MIYDKHENAYQRTCRAHMRAIQEFAQTSPDNMHKVYTFVICTIRMPLYRVPEQVREVDIKGVDARCLWGFKRRAYEYSAAFKENIYRWAMDTHQGYAHPDVRERELLHLFAEMPGLGLVKGGFMAQLCFGTSGCLDSNNLARFDLDSYHFHASRYKRAKTRATRDRFVDVYTDLVRWAGGSETLWQEWCQFVADRDGGHPSKISELHCEALGIHV